MSERKFGLREALVAAGLSLFGSVTESGCKADSDSAAPAPSVEVDSEALSEDPPSFLELNETRFTSEYAKTMAERLPPAEVDARLAALLPAIDSALRTARPRRKFFEHPFLELFISQDPALDSVKASAFELIRRMSPSDVARLNILAGTAVSGAEVKINGQKEKVPPFSRLREAWQWKRDKGTKENSVEYVDAILELDLDSLDHGLNVASWRQKHYASVDLLRRHSREFGFRDEVLNYMTPEVSAAVIHAELFSEIAAQSFVELLPLLFEPYNIGAAPAVYDGYCSGGAVQLTQETFSGILVNDGKKLSKIKQQEGGVAKFVVPTLRSDHALRDKAHKFDPDSFAEAMFGNVDSAIFYEIFTILDHSRPAFNILFSDPDFSKAWAEASDEEREIFVGSLAPLAINGGGPVSARVAKELLKQDGLSLREMAAYLPKTLPEGQTTDNAIRGAKIGYETMVSFVEHTAAR